MGQSEKKVYDDNKGRITAGIIVLGIGLVFQLSVLELIPPIEDMWPMFMIIVGAALLFGALRDRGKKKETSQLSGTTSPPPSTDYSTNSGSLDQ
jgi:hypothetical protein